jgi:outer membrane immunogenic protein
MKTLIRSLTVLFCCNALIALAGSDYQGSRQTSSIASPPCSWQGAYIGLHAGGQLGNSEGNDLDDYNMTGKWGFDQSGFVGGMQLGYNFQLGRIIIGPEVDFGYMNIEGKATEPGSIAADTFGETSSDFYFTLRGRAGVALDCWLFYVTGGAIGVNYDSHVVDFSGSGGASPNTLNGSNSDLIFGWTVGGGLERSIGEHWSVKLEYLYFNLENARVTARDPGGTPFRYDFESDGHMIRAGLNYRF